MKNLSFLQPQPLPFDFKDWKKQPFPERVKMLCTAWATQGYGAPVGTYSFYLLKIGFYVGMWIFFCSFSESLGSFSTIEDWWFAPEALLKGLLWSMLFEIIGLGCGSGPLTARYFPPTGGFLYFLRPGAIKLPLFPKIWIFGSDKRGWLDILLYLIFIGLLVRALIAPTVSFDILWQALVLLPILALFDKTLFLAARAEHYFIASVCFLFAGESLAGAKVVWLAIWFWAATSKLNRHFPAVVCVMISNSAVLRIPWLRKRIYKNYPEDLRPGKLATILAHLGTLVEYTFPLLLIFGDGGTLTFIGLVTMFCFHLFITSCIPMGVPLEWNVIMVYGAFVLFGSPVNISFLDIHSIELIATLSIFLSLIPLIGNFFPKWISFLLSMRYYAGNWAFSVWLFKENAEEKLDENLVKSAPTVMRQLENFYEQDIAESLVAKVIAFRAMHLHGRALQLLVPKAVDDIENYTWRDGELVAGVALGWNFGEGHLHDEQLLNAIQKRCNYKAGDLRCIFVESQPFLRPSLDWRIVDAKAGEIEKGNISVEDLLNLQPWPITQKASAKD